MLRKNLFAGMCFIALAFMSLSAGQRQTEGKIFSGFVVRVFDENDVPYCDTLKITQEEVKSIYRSLSYKGMERIDGALCQSNLIQIYFTFLDQSVLKTLFDDEVVQNDRGIEELPEEVRKIWGLTHDKYTKLFYSDCSLGGDAEKEVIVSLGIGNGMVVKFSVGEPGVRVLGKLKKRNIVRK